MTNHYREDAEYLRELRGDLDVDPEDIDRLEEIAQKLETLSTMTYHTLETKELEARVDKRISEEIERTIDTSHFCFDLAATWLLQRRVLAAAGKTALANGLGVLGAGVLGSVFGSQSAKGESK